MTHQSAWDWLHDRTPFVWTRENKHHARASKSEKKRWLQNRSVLVNGEPVAWDEPIDFPVFSVVLFPKGNRLTLF